MPVALLLPPSKASWNHYTEPSEAMFDGIERLEELEHDGSVELNSLGLQVTELGQHFLRNICMALDARLWADRLSTQLFSMAV